MWGALVFQRGDIELMFLWSYMLVHVERIVEVPPRTTLPKVPPARSGHVRARTTQALLGKLPEFFRRRFACWLLGR